MYFYIYNNKVAFILAFSSHMLKTGLITTSNDINLIKINYLAILVLYKLNFILFIINSQHLCNNYNTVTIFIFMNLPTNLINILCLFLSNK